MLNQWLRAILFLPQQATQLAFAIDVLQYVIIVSTLLGAAVVTLVGGYFLIRYSRHAEEMPAEEEEDTAPAAGHAVPRWLEFGVFFGLLAMFLTWWYIGFHIYVRMRIPPKKTMPVYVTAKQWMWQFSYPNGAKTQGALYVPAGRNVKLVMTSRDVIHSFFVPDFRLKQDVIPGRFTIAWFRAKKPGTHQLLCSEYCGIGHSTMRGRVVVLSPQKYDAWLHGDVSTGVAGEQYKRPRVPFQGEPPQALSMAEEGRRVAAEKGCFRCHTVDGTPHIGPTWAGLYMSKVPLQGGGTTVADEQYLTQSMIDPMAKIHRGFPAVMPSYQGQLSAAETGALVEFIESLKDVSPRPPRLRSWHEANGREEMVLPEPPALGPVPPKSPRGAPRGSAAGEENRP